MPSPDDFGTAQANAHGLAVSSPPPGPARTIPGPDYPPTVIRRRPPKPLLLAQQEDDSDGGLPAQPELLLPSGSLEEDEEQKSVAAASTTPLTTTAASTTSRNAPAAVVAAAAMTREQLAAFTARVLPEKALLNWRKRLLKFWFRASGRWTKGELRVLCLL